MMTRESPWKMTAMNKAMDIVCQQCCPLPPLLMALSEAQGCVLAEDVVATEPHPPFAASIMDGYAVHSSGSAGEYAVVGQITAGSADSDKLEVGPGQASYITTGAPLPAGTDAVVQLEHTQAVAGDSFKVKVLRTSTKGQWVRPVGCDIAVGETVLRRGMLLRAPEVGILASLGRTNVLAWRKLKVAVMSTGDELLPCDAKVLTKGKIRDSNRAMLLMAVREAGAEPVDMGMVVDCSDGVALNLQECVKRADVVVFSGGVSMGSKDFMKEVLGSSGQIHFGRLCMKPGKPTTFATVAAGVGGKSTPTPVFALPGNPVSAMVTFKLLVRTAIRLLAGHPKQQASLPQVVATLGTPTLKLDPARPEYHRVVLKWEHNTLMAYSTGVQRSSRLMSMAGATGLMEVPRGEGQLTRGEPLLVNLLGGAGVAEVMQAAGAGAIAEVMQAAGGARAGGGTALAKGVSSASAVPGAKRQKTRAAAVLGEVLRVCVLVLGDDEDEGEETDCLHAALHVASVLRTAGERIKVVAATTAALGQQDKEGKEGESELAAILTKWTDGEDVARRPHLIVTVGGLGFKQEDKVPEIVGKLFHRQAPGLQWVMSEAVEKFSTVNSGATSWGAAVLRGLAGTRHQSLLLCLPREMGALGAMLEAISPAVAHACKDMRR
jgi:gephyrin